MVLKKVFIKLLFKKCPYVYKKINKHKSELNTYALVPNSKTINFMQMKIYHYLQKLLSNFKMLWRFKTSHLNN